MTYLFTAIARQCVVPKALMRPFEDGLLMVVVCGDNSQQARQSHESLHDRYMVTPKLASPVKSKMEASVNSIGKTEASRISTSLNCVRDLPHVVPVT